MTGSGQPVMCWRADVEIRTARERSRFSPSCREAPTQRLTKSASSARLRRPTECSCAQSLSLVPSVEGAMMQSLV